MKSRLRDFLAPYSRVPLLGWFFGALTVVTLERLFGASLADVLGLQKIPVLFGFSDMLKNPALIPGVILYMLIVYAVPAAVA
ncbi:MAG: branched-chain amino acid ABC transporter permease, partial [Deltaproteobacteria bacterium]|nr:branched-chain amino acid ABC transporter permease [Deltaproteobacteria bacterium]